MFKQLAVASALSVVGFIGGAQADIINVFYTGTINGGVDASGLFGNINTSLVGKEIYVNYVFDTSLAPISTSSGAMSFSGGLLFSDQSPALSASITINGHAVAFGGSGLGTIAETSDTTQSYQYHQVTANDGLTDKDGNVIVPPSDVYSFVMAGASALPDSVLSTFSYSVKSTDSAFGGFDLTDGSYGTFLPSSISESVVSTVPLPSGLPMFGAALIGLGFMAFARRSTKNA